MSARAFTHPNFGKEVSVETCGREIRLIFVANTEAQVTDFAAWILQQLKQGGLHLSMMGKPTGVTKS